MQKFVCEMLHPELAYGNFSLYEKENDYYKCLNKY